MIILKIKRIILKVSRKKWKFICHTCQVWRKRSHSPDGIGRTQKILYYNRYRKGNASTGIWQTSGDGTGWKYIWGEIKNTRNKQKVNCILIEKVLYYQCQKRYLLHIYMGMRYKELIAVRLETLKLCIYFTK